MKDILDTFLRKHSKAVTSVADMTPAQISDYLSKRKKKIEEYDPDDRLAREVAHKNAGYYRKYKK